jgi:myo-inositol-1(or 4)-monophosphatase
MKPIDPELCGFLLRAVTDQLAQSVRPRADEHIGRIIGHIQAASARAKAALAAALAVHYPAIGWSDAEARPDRQIRPAPDENFWVYDPIDGAYHYAQGLPLWSASLALVSEGRTVLALVYDPVLRELFVAAEGGGATLNGAPVQASVKTVLAGAVVATAVPPFRPGDPAEHQQALILLGAVARHVFIIRQMASASLQLAYVAAGRLDGYWEIGRDVHDWLAGALLVRESGAAVTDLAGAPFDWEACGIVAAPPGLARGLLDAIAATGSSSGGS